ncbi:MAG: hypothetical protein QNJ54_21220 [Prochloraceae cyanobacterium]|nr:hypothetical protein [Prochloraceae cyanobacterium]
MALDRLKLTNSDSSKFTKKVEPPVSQKVIRCHLVRQWNCSEDNYPHCVSQWVKECYEVSEVQSEVQK